MSKEKKKQRNISHADQVSAERASRSQSTSEVMGFSSIFAVESGRRNERTLIRVRKLHEDYIESIRPLFPDTEEIEGKMPEELTEMLNQEGHRKSEDNSEEFDDVEASPKKTEASKIVEEHAAKMERLMTLTTEYNDQMQRILAGGNMSREEVFNSLRKDSEQMNSQRSVSRNNNSGSPSSVVSSSISGSFVGSSSAGAESSAGRF